MHRFVRHEPWQRDFGIVIMFFMQVIVITLYLMIKEQEQKQKLFIIFTESKQKLFHQKEKNNINYKLQSSPPL